MTIAIGETVGEGFNILSRRPLAFVGWAAAYLAFTVVAFALIGGALFGALAPLMSSPGTPPDPTQFMAILPGLLGAIALYLPLALIFNAVLVSAVFRAVLEPDNRGFAYLRFGSQELWLALVIFVEAVLFLFFYFASAIVIGILGAIGSIGGRSGLSVLLVVLGVLAMIGLLIYFAVRFSLAGPATFAERRFALFDSWGLTKGNVGSLFLTALVIMLICIGVAIAQFILSLVTNLAGFGLGAAGLGAHDPALANPVALIARLGPLFVVQLIVGAIFSSLYLVIANAPWAEAYRQIKGSDTPAVFS